MVLLPSWPEVPQPQHLTPPAARAAQVWLSPAAIAVTPLVRPVTSTGTLDWVVVPLPSWPLRLLPQHLMPPVVVRAQVWLSPATIAATPLVRPETLTGVSELLVVPLPSCPVALSPQQRTPLAAVRAQVWLLPAARRAPVGVAGGTVEVVVVDVVLVVDVVEVVLVVVVDVVLVVDVRRRRRGAAGRRGRGRRPARSSRRARRGDQEHERRQRRLPSRTAPIDAGAASSSRSPLRSTVDAPDGGSTLWTTGSHVDPREALPIGPSDPGSAHACLHSGRGSLR